MMSRRGRRAALPAPAPGRRRLVQGLGSAAALSIAGGCGRRDASQQVIDFWAMGREAEVVSELLPDFYARHPGVRVRIQQLPWTAAHEKLLTAFAGDALPDMCQLGNTWVSEFVALDALEPLDARVAASGLAREDYYAGILDTNVMPAAGGNALFGLPWYADTRLLFYRTDLLAAAGHDRAPRSWPEWLDAMRSVQRRAAANQYAALLPLNEPEPLFALALQQGPVLRDDDTRGAFSAPAFRRALDFYVGIFRQGLAAAVSAAQVSNVWDEFARGSFAFYVTGPWNIGEFRRRLPASVQGRWATAALPGPAGPGVSTAGGSSLVVFKRSARKALAWSLVEFLSDTRTMQRFHALTGDLPPRRSAWLAPGLAQDLPSQAFAQQLERVLSAPKIPQWERIFQEMQQTAERVVQRVQSADDATRQLDAWVDAVLEKRRWMRARGGHA